MPPDLLRERRDEKPLRSAFSCLASGVVFGAFVSLLLSYFFWKLRSPFPLNLVLIGLGVAVVSTILRYWLMPFIGRTIVLLNDSIYIQYGKSISKYRFVNVTECRLRPVIGRTAHYHMLSIRSDLKKESPFLSWRLSENLNIGIPDSIDIKEVERILRAGGVEVVTG